MPCVTKKCLVPVVCIVLMLPVIYWYKTEPYEVDAFYTNGSSDRRADGSHSATKDACQFPYFDPSHPHAMRYFKKYPTTSCPDGMPTISYYNGEQVKINMTKKIREFGTDKQLDCWYRKVTYRRSVNYMNGAWIGPFRDSVKVQGHPQFVEVKCQDGDKIVSRMHHYVTREEERRKAAALSPPKHDKQFQSDSLNVLMLCIDSMARHLLARAMPKTRKYLLETLGAVELHKYNKVGSNTFPNLLAVSAGIFTEDVPSWTHSSNMDELPFLWRDYKSAGYRTQYATDRPDFNDFTKPPTDSFTSPLAVSMMQDKIAFDNNCFEDQVEVPMWLNLVKEFARESIYSTGRFYSLTMMNRPTHDFPNQASAVDEHYYNFLKEMHETGVLNNTFMAFFGDHGPRMSAYRRTYFGSVEERAALMTIYVPKWFRVKYKEQYKNLLYNKDRLTTNFDVHETVRNLLSLETGGPLVTAYSKNTNDDGGSNSNNNDNNNNNINNNNNRNNNNEKSKIKQQTRRKNSHDHFQIRRSETGRQRAFSLFTKIPRDRTCADAAVSPHWCMCNGGVSVVDPDLMKDIGNQVVNDVNDLLQPKSDLCEKLSLKSVTSLSLMSGKVGRTSVYRIMLTAEPSGAVLEATVGYSVTLYFFRSAKTIGIPSRLDFYRGQSDCVSDEVTLKMFCYCKDFKLKNNVSVSDDINDNNNNSSSSSSSSRGSSSSSRRRRSSSSSSSSRSSSSGSRS